MWLVVDYGCVVSLDQTPEDRTALATAAGSAAQTDFDAGYWEHRDAYDLGVPSVVYWTRVLGRLPEPDEVARLDSLDAASWSHVNPAVEGRLAELSAAGVKLALLSNAPYPVMRSVEGLPVTHWFERRFFSCELKLMKPDPACYAAVTDSLGVPAGDIVFVDDREVNVAAAERAGWSAVLFEPGVLLPRP